MIEESAIRPTQVEIDLDALRSNAAVLRKLAGTGLYAVVKADAYGHGAPEVCRALVAGGEVAGFAVSLVEEGTELRDAGIELPILVMGPALAGGYDEIIGRNLTAMISDPGDLESLAAAAARRGIKIPVHLKIDTGMGRLGILPERLGTLMTRLRSLRSIEVIGLATHFACADMDDPADPECMTYAQLRTFDRVIAAARAGGLNVQLVHTANSSATLLFPQARRDLVRCGLALYGNTPHQPAVGRLRQAMRLVSHVAQLRDVAAGASVSYGALWRATRPSRLAVVPIGYADGVPRRFTGAGEVLIGGQRCPMVGAVSMDISIVDVTELGDTVRVGAEVVLLGRQGESCITTREFATWGGLTEYEVTCGMSKRVPRVYQAAAQTAAQAAARSKREPAAVERLWPERKAAPEALR